MPAQVAPPQDRKGEQPRTSAQKGAGMSARKREQALDSEIRQNLEKVGHLTDELDGILAEMGRQTVVVRLSGGQAGVPAKGKFPSFRIAAGMQRTIEVKLPQGSSEESGEWHVTIEAHLDSQFHEDKTAHSNHLSKLLPEEPFEISVCDTAQRASDSGPYRATGISRGRKPCTLSFSTDCSSCFLNLWAKKACHVLLACRALPIQPTQAAGQVPNRAEQSRPMPTRDGEEGSDSSDSSAGGDGPDGHARRLRSSKADRRLQGKIKRIRQAMSLDDDTRKQGQKRSGRGKKHSGASTPSSDHELEHVARSLSIRFGEFVFPDGRNLKGPVQILQAQLRVLQLWLGPIHPLFTPGSRRARGSWVRQLSADCPRKLIRFLRKTAQNRSALVTLMVGGAMAFFLRRQRELHLVRARTALRQLMWYKSLFAASRFRFLVVFAAKGREQTRDAALALRAPVGFSSPGAPTAVAPMARRKSLLSAPVGSEKSAVELVRGYNDTFGRAGRSSVPGKGHARSGGPAVAEASEGGEKSIQPNSPMTPQRAVGRKDLGPVNLGEAFRLARQGFFVHPRPSIRGPQTFATSPPAPEAETSCSHSKGKRPSALNSAAQDAKQRGKAAVKELSSRLGRHIVPQGQSFSEPAHAGIDDQAKLAIQEVNSATLVMTIRPRELPLALSGFEVKFMGAEQFQSFYQKTITRAAEDLVRRRACEANNIVPVTKNKKSKVFTKR
ncbi:unnamed protein product [Polarella glacialis]|uniref:Uncharacterized protein n=1 Tax=Polarella glacialis TaxID=89957 RepID=A0A813FPG8_POLGL|nr:unnamed protein product [Polarella glacialis]CAE8616003.1 unnamed protein product [Polarella glacialis]CAE8737505.1 unnamed protein product [Polarella glacialis]